MRKLFGLWGAAGLLMLAGGQFAEAFSIFQMNDLAKILSGTTIVGAAFVVLISAWSDE